MSSRAAKKRKARDRLALAHAHDLKLAEDLLTEPDEADPYEAFIQANMAGINKAHDNLGKMLGF